MKRKIALLLVFCMLASLAPAAVSEDEINILANDTPTTVLDGADSGLPDLLGQSDSGEDGTLNDLLDLQNPEIPDLLGVDLPDLQQEQNEDAAQPDFLLHVNESYTLDTAALALSNEVPENQTIAFSSSDPTIADVTSDGTIVALATGDALINCLVGDASIAVYTVKVIEALDATPVAGPADETPVDETPADKTPADETPADETPADETPADETPGDQTPTDETPADETPADETPADETPADETPADETPTDETPADETPADETPADETPADETPADETPADETPADETPADETPADETPADETPADETPADETPADETPADETPADETPADETPADETPADETPADETPADETPADETPADETPADETPADETPADETPADETPADETPADETPADETPADETPADETPADETPANETPADETPADETPADETPTDETPADETPADETPADETPADETLGDQTPADETPADETPGAEAHAGDTSIEGTPAEDTNLGDIPVEKVPAEAAEETYTEELPVEKAPAEAAEETPADQSTDKPEKTSVADDPQPTDPQAQLVPEETEETEDASSTEASQGKVPSKLELGVKEKYTLDTKSLAKGGKITYKTSKKAVATVSSTGVITGVKAGTATITCMRGKTKVATCTVKVVKAPTKVTLKPKTVTLGVKESQTLTPTLPKGTHASFTWSVKNKKIATVSKDGVVKGVKAGSTTVTVKTHNGKKATVTVKVVKAPTKVTLKPKTVTLGVKETLTLTPTLPKGTHASFTWSVKDKKIATVSKDGVVKGVKAGSTTVTVKTHNGKKATVTVKVVKAPAKVTLEPKTVTLGLKETLAMTPTLPKGTHASFTWSVKNKKIATVSKDGVVKGVKTGSTTVTVKTHNGKTATVTVKVVKAPTKVTLEPKTVTLNVKETLTLTPTLPNGTHASFTWSVKDKKIATVSKDGVVKGVKVGTTTVTVKTHNGKTATVTVNVVKLDNQAMKDAAAVLGISVTELAELAGVDLKTLNGMSADEIKALEFTTDNVVWKLNDGNTGVVIVKYNGTKSSLTINDKYYKLPVTEIGESAFEGNEKLKEVNLPSTVTVIGKRAFKNCVNLSKMQ